MMQSTSLDLTQLAVQIVSLSGAVAIAWLSKMITTHLRNQAARNVLNAALPRAVGFLQQMGEGAIRTTHPQLSGVPASIAPAVQYMLDHAGEELDRFGISAESIGEKVSAEIGKTAIASNIAVNSSATSTVVTPLAPVSAAMQSPVVG